jgi:hypothetical protein
MYPSTMIVPTRMAVRKLLTELANGVITREEASTAAWPWIGEREAEVTDSALWEPLGWLAGADTKTGPGSYLYGHIDFEDWLQEFELTVELGE